MCVFFFLFERGDCKMSRGSDIELLGEKVHSTITNMVFKA